MESEVAVTGTAGLPLPLNAQQFANFVHEGYLLLYPTVPGGEDFHRLMCEQAKYLRGLGEIGNNLLAQCEHVDAVLDAPEIVGALTSLLGEDYALSAHRHCHVAMEGSQGQTWHQDSFFGFQQFRHAAPTDVMIMYYPQAVSDLMGPTAIVPGSQYGRQWSTGMSGTVAPQSDKLMTTERPGACLLMHYHLWHRGTQQLGGSNVPMRFMFKFQFRRTRPLQPAPPFLGAISAGANPFIDAVTNTDTREGYHRRVCAGVWAVLAGKPLPPEQARVLSELRPTLAGSLATAIGERAQSYEQVVWEAESVANVVEKAATLKACPVSPHGSEDETIDERFLAAGSLQLCYTVDDSLGQLIIAATARSLRESGWTVAYCGADWRLEAISALPAVLSPLQAIQTLVTYLTPPTSARIQFHALLALYSAALRCEECELASVVADTRLDEILMWCAGYWQAWLTHVTETKPESGVHQATRAQPWDCCGRYVLAEALRCLGRTCSFGSVQRAIELIGAHDKTQDLLHDQSWRQRFIRFVERRRVCPITTSSSPF